MKLLQVLCSTMLASVMCCLPAFAQMPGTANQSDRQITASERLLLIDNLIREVDNRYVFPDRAKKVAASLREQEKRGAYDKITSAQQLSSVLTQKLQAEAGDRHLRVMYSEKLIPERKPNTEPSPDDVARYLAITQSDNFGVEKIEHLPFNIGYRELASFVPVKDAAETLAAAMTVLAHTDALIIDLRDNGGGDAAASALMASYFLDERSRLNDLYYREDNRVEQRWSLEVVPGLRYGRKKDVYILTSKDTFSAAEDFTYALKNLKRATVVGETTGGGANSGDDIRLLPNFAAFIPLSRLISPYTKSNWEGIGITPDMKVCAADAMRIAQAAILKKWIFSEKAPAKLEHMNRRITELGTENVASTDCH